MTLKEPVAESARKLRSLMHDNGLANAVRLTRLGFVHSARFVIMADKFAVITSYDFDFRDYLHTFVDELGDLFDMVLPLMQDAPPTPVREHRDEFVDYISRIRVEPDLFYSAYPDLSVQNILTMREGQEGGGRR
jgi:hypothetical protein